MPFAGWSPIGIAALFAIVAGIAMLIVYAVQRGLVNRELEGIEAAPVAGLAEAAAAPAVQAASGAVPVLAPRYRTIGLLGAILLVMGLALGLVAAVGSWGAATSSGMGLPPGDCAQTWQGCPQATVKP